MKQKTLGIIIAALVLAIPTETYAQGFLKKLKQKAESAVNKVVGLEEEEPEVEINEENAGSKPTATDRVPKLRQTTFVWDGQVSPSTANTVQQLLNELPSLPSVEQIANPDDAQRQAYYNRLSAISMRVNELDEEWTCSDDEMEGLRNQLYTDLAETYGITIEEMKALEDPNTSEAEKARIEEKIKQSVLGGMDVNNMQSMADNMADKSKKHEARMEELSKEMEVLEKKAEKGTLTEAEQARMMQLSQEAMAIQQDVMGGVDMNALMNIGKKENALMEKYSMATMRMEQRLKAYSDKAAALQKSDGKIVMDCNEIAADYEEKLRTIYTQIYNEDDVDKIHALYDQADELMKNYRTRAAKIWIKSLSTRLEQTKKLLPEAIEIYGEMVKEGLLPECALRRPQLNVVTACEDILDEAYADFPQPDVLPYRMEGMNIMEEDERILYPESGFVGGFGGSGNLFDDFKNGSQILVYNEKEQAYYKLEGGNRTKLAGEGPHNFFDAKKKVNYSYGEIPLRKGNRKATFSTGRTLTLHDGTMVYPVAFRRYDDRLEFIVHDVVNDKEDFYMCVYKL
ncbi:MAG: hypothetical protein E7099_08705 [Mediterranea massiliensis]|nr:hypothetical protein [Mediterranea massiliensis]